MNVHQLEEVIHHLGMLKRLLTDAMNYLEINIILGGKGNREKDETDHSGTQHAASVLRKSSQFRTRWPRVFLRVCSQIRRRVDSQAPDVEP
jgi:hypothetical protein